MVDFKQSTNHCEDRGRQRINAFAEKKQEELSRDQMSTVIAFNHIRSNSSLILRRKTIIRKELYICTYISANITTAIRTYENFRGRFVRKKAMSPKFYLFIYFYFL